MPSTSDELRAEWPGGDTQATAHLTAKGFELTKEWLWIMPYRHYRLTMRDSRAIQYMIEEWDYGGLAAEELAPPDLKYEQPRLTAIEQYILGLIAEEAAEVTKMAVGKTLRFGFRMPGRMQEDGEPDFSSTPENELYGELGDLLAAIELSFHYGVFERARVMNARNRKIEKILKERDNMGRPLAPPLPALPIRGPDGSTWEPENGPWLREEVIVQRIDDNQNKLSFVNLTIPGFPQEKPKVSLWKRFIDWGTRSKKTNDDLSDFG